MACARAADRAAEAGCRDRFEVTFRDGDGPVHLVTVAADEYVLDAGLRAGLDLPHRCLQGWCLTCAARLVRGEVDQRDSRRYYDADREAGFVLICTARPRADLVLDIGARDAMRRARAARGLPFPMGNWGARSTESP